MAATTDEIVIEMIKAAGKSTMTLLHQLCNKICSAGKWPGDWTESIYVPIHKKCAKYLCQNYRTIALINQTSKVMLYIVQKRLKSYLLPQIPAEQVGFVPGRGTRDLLFNVK